MNINNLYEIYFSPTGGTKEAVEVFGAQWNIAKSVVDLADMNVEFDKYEFYNDDLCIIGVPSFGGRAPAVAIQRLKELKGNNTPVVIIATYGNRAYEDTLIELQQTVEEVGFCVVAALSVVTQHSIVSQYGMGRPDDLDRTRLVEMSIKIKVHIERANGFNTAKLSEKKPFKEYSKSSLKPSNVGRCIGCGICARNCPVGAIPLDNPKATDYEKCITCMRCVAKCPKDSRKLSDVKVTALATKIRKECSTRKEIEIFVNKNLNNDVIVYNNEHEIIIEDNESKINEQNINEPIEEISVSKIAMEDAMRDVNLDGIVVDNSDHNIQDFKNEEPIYEGPQEPMYEEPIYEEPQEPVYEEPIYEGPQEPMYEEPIYEGPQEPMYEEPIYEGPQEPIYEEQQNNILPTTFADMQKLFGNQTPIQQGELDDTVEEITKEEIEEEVEEVIEETDPEILRAQQLEDIPDDFVLPEPEEITMPENMKGVSLDDIDNNPYELDDDLLEEDEIEEILELDEIVEQERPEVENPKDFILNISEELEDLVDDVEEVVEEIEDEIGVVLEDV